MTGTTNRAAADGVVTTRDADHFERWELASTLADEEWVVLVRWAGGGVDIDVYRCNPSGSFSDITGVRKVSLCLAKRWKM